MNIVEKPPNQLITTNDQKRHRSVYDDNIKTLNRMKRKTSLTNSEEIIHTSSKKIDTVNSTEFESKDEKNQKIIDEAILNKTDQENDFDDYTDRIFNYLGETCSRQTTLTLPQVNTTNNNNEINSSLQSIDSSDKEIKPFLCTFCPYFTRNLEEFQIHLTKHSEKNFRCLLCNCMYKYRRDCVTHMKRKHSNNVTGSISQYIQKINNNSIQSSSSTPLINNSNTHVEPKRYGCPYCSLMTKSTSSIYKHQSRKHASFPKIVHKYSTDDPTTRNIVAILKQKSIKDEQNVKSQTLDESVDPSNVPSPSSSFTQQQTESLLPSVNRHRCPASKHIIAHNIPSSNGHLSKVFQCCLCGYRAHHRSNVVRHVKKLHTNDLKQQNPSSPVPALTNNTENLDESNENSTKLIVHHTDEQIPNYSFTTTVQAPLILNKTSENTTNPSTKPYADIHLSINIFLPKKFQRTISHCSNNNEDLDSDEDTNNKTKIYISSSSDQQNFPSGSLYKPHKCRRCFYRSNWKTDMLHHIRLKHHIDHATKSDYISMDYNSALNSFTNYEKTFGKVLKNRLLLPKIEYIDCTWEEFKSKFFQNKNSQYFSSTSSSIEQITIINNKTSSSMNNDE